jgi:hypothetical protein
MLHALYALLHTLWALWALLCQHAPHHPAPAPHRPPVAPQGAQGTRQALGALRALLRAHHVHAYRWQAYGGPGSRNAGVVANLGHGHCVGYEFRGTPGWFGNVWGLRGGDCS